VLLSDEQTRRFREKFLLIVVYYYWLLIKFDYGRFLRDRDFGA